MTLGIGLTKTQFKECLKILGKKDKKFLLKSYTKYTKILGDENKRHRVANR
jgi:hypothetical protein